MKTKFLRNGGWEMFRGAVVRAEVVRTKWEEGDERGLGNDIDQPRTLGSVDLSADEHTWQQALEAAERAGSILGWVRFPDLLVTCIHPVLSSACYHRTVW